MSLAYSFTESVENNLLISKDNLNIRFHANTFDWPITHRHLDYWEFTLVTQGVIINKTQRGAKQYEKNQMFISTTRSEHCLIAPNPAPLRYINISVRESYLLRLLDSINPNLKVLLTASDFSVTLPATTVSEIDQKLQSIDNFDISTFEENNICKESCLLLLLSNILSELTASKLRNKNSWQNKLNQLLQSGELVRMNVSDLCRVLDYSRTHLNLLFRKYYNTTPHDYLTNIKFSYAKNLLRCTNLSAESIAVQIGYSNPMQFFTTFKKIFGITPTQYRKNPQ